MVIALVRRLPEGTPRLAVALLFAAVLLLPRVRHLVLGKRVEQRKLDRARRLLEVRKLQMEVDTLKRGQTLPPDDRGRAVDAQVDAILASPELLEEEEHEEGRPLAWRVRMLAAVRGAGAFVVVALLLVTAGGVGSVSGAGGLARFALRELAVGAACAGLASLLPSRAVWHSGLYGFVLPIALGAVAALAR